MVTISQLAEERMVDQDRLPFTWTSHTLVDSYELAFAAGSNASALVDHERIGGVVRPFLKRGHVHRDIGESEPGHDESIG